jgi:hypothetical protein
LLDRGEAEITVADHIITIIVNQEPWEVRRFDVEGWFHRRPYSTIWLGGLPPGANIDEVETAYDNAVSGQRRHTQ